MILSGYVYLAQHHGGDLLRRERLGLTEVLDLHFRVVVIVSDLEWPRLDVLLHCRVVESPSDQTPDRSLAIVRRSVAALS